MRHLWIFAFLASLLLSCSDTKPDKRGVAVTNASQAWIAQNLLGNDSGVEIIKLLPPGADPEHFEPSVQTLRSLGNAESWFYMDTPGFERQLMPKIKENFPNLEIVDVTVGIDRDLPHFHSSDSGHLHDESEEESDPHILTSLRNAKIMTNNMADKMAVMFPEMSDSIEARRSALIERLTALDDSIADVFDSGFADNGFLIEHPSLGYFARDYGLHQIAMEQGHREATPAERAEKFAEAVSRGVKVIVVEQEHPSAGAADLAKNQGLRIVEVPLGGPDYLASFRILVSALNKGNSSK